MDFINKSKFSLNYGILNFIEISGGISTEGIAKIKINTNFIEQIPLTSAISLGYFPGFYLSDNYFLLLYWIIGYKNKRIILSNGTRLTVNFSSLVTICDISNYNTAIWNINDFSSISVENLFTWSDKGFSYSTIYLYLNGLLKNISFIKNINISGGIKEDLLNNNFGFIFGASIEIDIPENINKLEKLLNKLKD
ncbi:hypothetical protein [Marinitoga sp. 38H-ov]|uniref:hypothetical protein n=1 Tax=Marinitoga sp. 38H-ov TaxID=1755814 RepID=UPI0013EDDAC3|nr:hypothetical protein [Marinitoga sp. 38H-ov]KAF2955153.1 hypothetical protein AS160_02105 [Marinitoga sp. 38H-ov]